MSDETTLLPCPFCGGEAETHETIDGWIATCKSEQSELDEFTHMAQAYGATEAEAIAAWNTRTHGTLTAEQVREAIEHNFSKVAVIDDGGEKVEWREGWVCNVGFNLQAIADELNAKLRNGTCEWVLEHSGTMYDKWRCSECGYLFVEPRCDQGYTDLEPNFCPSCGREVVER